MQLFINCATFLAYSLLTGGVILQIIKTFKTTIEGIAITEVACRLSACLIILIKLFSVGDYYLILGHSVLTSTVAFHFLRLIYIKYIKSVAQA